MSDAEELAHLRDMIATLPLDDACRVVISELRTGVMKAHTSMTLLRSNPASLEDSSLTDEERQHCMEVANVSIRNTMSVIDELLVDGLLRRLEVVQGSRGSDHIT